MSTGIFSDWGGAMMDLGPLYPLVGWETVMVILLAVFWVGWHVVQIRGENRQWEEETRRLREGDNLLRAVQAEHTPERM
ncbi:MAG: hypothetical protein WAW79_10595 [Steroidobacteraceae bacterium]